MNARRVAIVLLASLVVVAPAQAQEDHDDPGSESSTEGGNQTADRGTSSDGGDGNETASGSDDTSDGNDAVVAESGSSQHEDGQAHTLDVSDGDDRPCGIFYWSPKDPDRVILDPNSCFIPLITDLT